jgi:uncharacterized protein YdiU (UPF0061 family)
MKKPTKSPFLNLKSDQSWSKTPRQTPDSFSALVKVEQFEHLKLIGSTGELSEQVGLMGSKDFHHWFSATPTFAMNYGGHQFGRWAGQLGDGRAINIGLIDGQEAQLKGSGMTAYSRRADGRAVLRSSVREFLMSEAMHFLGVPTSRCLMLFETGEKVLRDPMYDGNPIYEKGAMVLRTAPSFIRFGHFELWSSMGKNTQVKELLDFCIEQYFPNITKGDYLRWFQQVATKTMEMVIEWMRVGFVHGVMNTDNLSIHGLTIDYGPFAILDEFDQSFTSNTTDLPGRRYAFGNQLNVALWNLARLAESILPVTQDLEGLKRVLENYEQQAPIQYKLMLAKKLGVSELSESFLVKTHNLLLSEKFDYNLFFLALENYLETKKYTDFENASHGALNIEKLKNYLDEYETFNLKKFSKVNPKFVLKNHFLQKIINELEVGGTDLFTKALKAIKNPYTNDIGFNLKRSVEAKCTMLSCSS